MHGLQSNLSTWELNTKRGRHDYDSSDHLIQEMLHAEYFGPFHWCFTAGDLIYVTDAAGEQATLAVDGVDANARRVWLSVLERFVAYPITNPGPSGVDSGLIVKWRGPRGGGWCIVNKANDVLARDFKSKDEAERALMALLTAQMKTEAA